jgi:hypothetical protein
LIEYSASFAATASGEIGLNVRRGRRGAIGKCVWMENLGRKNLKRGSLEEEECLMSKTGAKAASCAKLLNLFLELVSWNPFFGPLP